MLAQNELSEQFYGKYNDPKQPIRGSTGSEAPGLLTTLFSCEAAAAESTASEAIAEMMQSVADGRVWMRTMRVDPPTGADGTRAATWGHMIKPDSCEWRVGGGLKAAPARAHACIISHTCSVRLQ